MLDASLDFDRCYAAVESRDARFDGWFIVAVRTTGVYCRPSCPAPRTPKRENVTFYRSAAAAQVAGFRACKRCRPDAAPGSPEWDLRADVVGRAMRLIGDGVVDHEGVAGLARRLSVSSRHLQRLLAETVGASALELARARRAQTALALIETTGLAFSEIAFAAGFSSVRQFNDTIRRVYGTTPTALRAARRRGDPSESGTLSLRLAVRPPFDAAGMLRWFADRAIDGLESVDGCYRRALRLPGGYGDVALEPHETFITATFRLDSLADLATAVDRCRRLLDLDADPRTYVPLLGADPLLRDVVARSPGRRAPGSADASETLIRAIIGQQVSLDAARTIGGRLVARHGGRLRRPDGWITHVFPSPEALAEADLAGIGLTPTRQHAVREAAARLACGEILLDPGADRPELYRQLRAVPGVGDWTAAYTVMRGLGDPDTFPASDLGLRRAAALLGVPSATRGLGRHAERWRPWRTYAAHYLWTVAAQPAAPPGI